MLAPKNSGTSHSHVLPGAVIRPVLPSGLLTSHAAAAQGQPGETPAPPNVIVIYVDDLGAGMRFTQGYSGSPACGPSHCSLMTGEALRPRRGPRPLAERMICT
ncbi:MAG: hypothetical protein ACJAZN_000009 [Planctomycetota bacterium]|jgi:hypothetical protein